MAERTYTPLDRLIGQLDQALQTVFGPAPHASRPNPAHGKSDEGSTAAERELAGRLMRINHTGEICAQALYQGQALASGDSGIQEALRRAASEEVDHLAWSAQRIRELGGRTSLLNPLWYAGALVLGLAAGKLGDRWNLGFLAETERQVEDHLQGHLERLGERDAKTRAVIEVMQREEAEHRRTAETLGASRLPRPVGQGMRWAAKVMTTASYWI
jgi:ubiquinone biosynthesis monooxygenase Coq7